MSRIKALIMKDFFTARNSVKSLLISYTIFLFVLFMMKNYFQRLNDLPDNILIIIAIILFVSMGLLFITTGFMRYIFQESAIGKEEIYFAYGYGVGELCFGKALFFTVLSLVIPYILVLLFFSGLLKTPFFLFNILLILPILFLLISYLVIFLTWFTKLGTAVYFVMFFGVFFLISKVVKKIIKMKLKMNLTTIISIELGIILILFIISYLITKLIKKENLIEKLS